MKKESIFGAPSIKNIAVAAHGEKANNKVIKSVMEDCFLVSLMENGPGLINSCVRRAIIRLLWRDGNGESVKRACALVNEKGADGVD